MQCPTDLDIVKELCKQWFPIKYPESWYEDVTAGNKFYTLIATIEEEIIGILVAEIKPYTKCNYEDVGLLCKNLEKTSRVAYILTIGVVGKWRRHGIATILLNKLKENLTDDFNNGNLTRAIYLHVLTTNIAAIRFYEKLHFTRHKFLPLYYLINSASCDGYCYVLYINGGQPPATILGRTRDLLELCCLCFSLRPFRWLLNISRLTKMCFSNLSSKFVGSPTVKYKGGTYTC